jgi:hypothetical protein
LQSELHIFLDEPTVPPSGPSSPAVTIAPSVQKIGESVNRWREGSRLATVSRRGGPLLGTTFSFSLSEPATASLSFTRRILGRKVHGGCIAETGKNRHGASCKARVVAGALSFTAHAGTNKVAFEGCISRSKCLKPGPYTLTVRATNSAGVSNPRKLTFTIVK